MKEKVSVNQSKTLTKNCFELDIAEIPIYGDLNELVVHILFQVFDVIL